ncbi:MAG: DUF1501 domain-containing protein [Casimicrobium sp.]
MDRRQFLQHSAALSTLPALPFSITVADAAGGITPNANETGYKALVCVFLFGGNDSHNTIVPYQSGEYNAYLTARGGLASANGLALPQGNLNPLIAPGGSAASTPLALHPAMTRIGSIYNAGKMAVIANCGPLLDETTLAQYNNPAHPLPPQLFSHSDMQMHWQTMIPDQPADTGWGGRMADAFRVASSGRLPVSIGFGSGGIFMKGDVTVPYNLTPVRYKNGTIDLGTAVARTPQAAIGWNWTVDSANPNSQNRYPQDVFQNNYLAARANLLEQQYAKTTRASLEVGEFVRDAMYNVADVAGVGTQYTLKNPVPGTWPAANPLAAQLHAVAAMIAARSALGTTRQIFFVSIGGFDNHGDQFGDNGSKTLLAGKHFQLLNYVDEALKTFYDATVSMGVADNVTTMTMSDFGRTMKSNGQGSDHGWGGHYFVLGGKVKGGKVIGAQTSGGADTNYFPMASQLAGQGLDVGEGRLLPTISSDAYTATLASWFGANSTELDQIFPNLRRFNVKSLDLMNP